MSRVAAVSLIVYLLVWRAGPAYSRVNRSFYVDPRLWSKIETGLRQNSTSPACTFIPTLVTSHFNNQPDSVYRSYYAVMLRLGHLFNLNAAICIGEEMVELARKQRNPAWEATAYTNLSRYYDALGRYPLSAVNIEKAQAIHKATGDENALLASEYDRLTLLLHITSRTKIIPRLTGLLDKAFDLGATLLVIRDESGQLVSRRLVQPVSDRHHEVFDTSHQRGGLLLLRVEGAGLCSVPFGTFRACTPESTARGRGILYE